MSLVERLQFGFSKRLPMHLQAEAAECGLACLSMIASYHGFDTDLASLRQRFSFSLKGATMGHLIEIGAKLELVARPLRLALDELQHLQLPCVLHWDLNHFVVLQCVERRGIVIHDPASGTRRLSLAEVSASFTGVALELLPSPSFRRQRERKQLRLREMMGKVVGLRRSLSQIFLLAAALEAFSLVAPFFNQWVVDQALLTGDKNLLYTLALGFGLLATMQVVIEAVRGWAVTVMSTTLNIQWLGNVFQHLVNLPISYFEKRHMGDVVSRFNSLHTMQGTLTTSFVEAILDGMMALGTISMMIIYSPSLAAISLVAISLYVVLRFTLYAGLRSASQKEIIFAAKQETLFMETIRGIQSIRVFNRTDQRVAQWLNVVVDQKNCSLRTQRLLLLFKTAHQLVFSIDSIVVMLFGALLVLERQFSVGMLLAFLSYKMQFSARVSSLVDKVFEVKMLELHGARLADIVLTPRIRDKAQSSISLVDGGLGVEIGPSIEVRKLSFRYSDQEPQVLKGIDFKIEAGESVAIVGASGCGKSTLLKILLGLHSPSGGQILIGGTPLSQLGVASYREMIGAVLQDDQLFAGSVADNISFFSRTRDDMLIQSCAREAAIHDEIVAMPMGYNTLVGDMGAALSGGQKQRILLARALYRKPKILILDEATSHLDVDNEHSVNRSIRRLKLTRIIVAHRPETIASADRLIEIHAGKVVTARVRNDLSTATA